MEQNIIAVCECKSDRNKQYYHDHFRSYVLSGIKCKECTRFVRFIVFLTDTRGNVPVDRFLDSLYKQAKNRYP
jgi:hypothetical protein